MSTAAAPTGTVTAVMGDVVGSSGLWEREPESMAAAISQLGELTRELAGVHGGHLPVEQGEGDNLVAVFAEAGRAAAFALEVAAAVRTRGWPGGIELRLRLGMDTGDATHDPETGYQGGVFNRCSRLRNLVDETRILISSTTRGLIIDTLPTGAAVDDRGHRHLRGHDRPEHVWELRGDDVPPASQPLPPDDHGGSIPLETSPLVGRDDEVARLQKAVADHRLVTLTGAGGAGKTRLAQHIGLAALEDQRDGVWWVDLSPVTDAHRVPTAIAEAVGLDEAAGSGAALRLVADLTQRHGLLILDNCEHLLDAVADVVEPVLVSCPDITVLVTSRELLDLDGEQAVRVRPLGLPDTDEIAAAALGDWPATALFVARASAVTPLAPTDEDASRIVQICRRLDGLPLAIELAATRARVLSLERILEGLDDRFGLLVGRRRASSRQRTLEASIAWSYELLPSAEQHALNRLSVFPGPFDLDGAIAVIGGDGSVGEHAATQLLSSLVDKSLVSVRDGQRARRYRLLDSIRHFAADRLHESDDEERARDAHLEHVLALGRDGLHGLHSTRLAALAGTADLREELEDVRAAEAHALERGRAEDVVALHLPWFSTHIVNSTYHEARRTLRRLVDEPDLGPVARTRAAAMLATYLAAGGRAGDAADRTSEVLADARGTDDALTVLLALVADSYAATWAGREGLDAAQEAWELAQQRAEDWGDGTVALAGLFAGIAIGHLGGGSAGLDILRSAASTAEHVRDNGLAATAATYAAAEAFRLPATVEECRRALEHALQLAPATLPRLRSLAHAVAGTFAPLLWGDVAMARRNVDIAGALAGPIGGGTHAIHAVAEAFTTTVEGDLDRALEQTTFVRNLFAMTSHRWWQMFCADGLAMVHCARGEWDEARAIVDDTWPLLPEPPTWPVMRSRIGGLRAMLFGREDPELGLGLALDELARCWDSGHRTVAPVLITTTATFMSRLGRVEDAARTLGIGDRVRGDWFDLSEILSDFDRDDDVVKVLGRERYDELFAEGAGMEPDDGVAWLLRGRGAHARATFGWEALTPTERSVAEKAAEGLSNQQIADALFVSPNTVKTHLRNIYTKLRVSSRAALATEFAEHRG